MNGILADVFAIYMKTENFHWHMSGAHFRDYHLLLDEQAGRLYALELSVPADHAALKRWYEAVSSRPSAAPDPSPENNSYSRCDARRTHHVVDEVLLAGGNQQTVA